MIASLLVFVSQLNLNTKRSQWTIFILFSRCATSFYNEPFIMIFRYSEEARERIFREIAILCKEEPFITNLYAQKLFYLVLSILTDSTVRSDERIYQRILEQLYRAIGLQLELLLEVLAGVCIKFDPAIVQIVNKLNFIKKYVYPLRDKDNYVIAIR